MDICCTAFLSVTVRKLDTKVHALLLVPCYPYGTYMYITYGATFQSLQMFLNDSI